MSIERTWDKKCGLTNRLEDLVDGRVLDLPPSSANIAPSINLDGIYILIPLSVNQNSAAKPLHDGTLQTPVPVLAHRRFFIYGSKSASVIPEPS